MRDADLTDLLAGAVDGWPAGAMRWRPPEILDAELEELADRIHQQGLLRSRITAGITHHRERREHATREASAQFLLWPIVRRAYTWAGDEREPAESNSVMSTGVPTGHGTYLHTDPR